MVLFILFLINYCFSLSNNDTNGINGPDDINQKCSCIEIDKPDDVINLSNKLWDPCNKAFINQLNCSGDRFLCNCIQEKGLIIYMKQIDFEKNTLKVDHRSDDMVMKATAFHCETTYIKNIKYVFPTTCILSFEVKKDKDENIGGDDYGKYILIYESKILYFKLCGITIKYMRDVFDIIYELMNIIFDVYLPNPNKCH
jgi:hypothetical protein